MAAVIADNVSLSPNLISDTAKVSFSLTIGMAPISSNAEKVFCALRYCVRCYDVNECTTECDFETYVRNIISGEQDLPNWLPQMAE